LTNGIRSLKTTTPRIPVSDGVGVVVGIGDRVTRFRTGDRVAGIFNPNWLDWGCTAEKVAWGLGIGGDEGGMGACRLFNEQVVVAVPSYLTDVEAATLPDSGVTAWHAICLRNPVRRGDRVLIQGTGGVSTFALLFVRVLGGEPIVISSSDQKLE